MTEAFMGPTKLDSRSDELIRKAYTDEYKAKRKKYDKFAKNNLRRVNTVKLTLSGLGLK